MMRSFLLAIFIGFVLLISATLKAKAESVTLAEVGNQRPLKAKRSLKQVQTDNSKPSQLGRKAGIGHSAATPQNGAGKDDDDDVNESYGNYGNEDSKGDSHHYYPDDRRPKH